MTLKLGSKQRLVMIGDSITDAGRSYPIGTAGTGLGDGYVSIVNALLTAHYPELGITVYNTGIGGQTSRDLPLRWTTDVFDLRPDWVTLMIGTNDVWRQFDQPDHPEYAVLPDDYVRNVTGLVTKTLPKVKGLTLLTPFYIEPKRTNPMRKRMDEYTALVKKIGAETGVTVLDTQAIYDQAMEYVKPKELAGDGVHPTLPGHALLATAVLNELGFEWKR